MTIEEMWNRKSDLGYSYEKIAELTGLDEELVEDVFIDDFINPPYDVLQKLENILGPENNCMVCEPGNAYQVYPKKRQGEYTAEDYFAWPEEERIELIDGVIYSMASPTKIHQLINGELFAIFRTFVRKNRGDCIPAVSPLDVKLGEDDKTVVQPDVIVICGKDRLKEGGKKLVIAVPDLLVEVLSPLTRKKDMTIKLKKYTDSGVREYWIVDPRNKRVIVHDLEHGDAVTLYGFEEKIPVRIFENKCEVDFAEIYDYVSFLYDGN